jgi:glutamate 5-kinase
MEQDRRCSVTEESYCFSAVPVRGKIHVDAGCAEALQQKKNLYAAGVMGVEGKFGVMDAVEIVFRHTSIARGLANYTSTVRFYFHVEVQPVSWL